jgi:hypothetical protein
MLILFDHGTPRGIARFLVGHTIREAKAQGWDRLTNGELLSAAEGSGFEALVTTDRNIRYQQNLAHRKIAIIVLGKARWQLIKAVMPSVVSAVDAAKPGTYVEVDIPNLVRL